MDSGANDPDPGPSLANQHMEKETDQPNPQDEIEEVMKSDEAEMKKDVTILKHSYSNKPRDTVGT